MSVPVRGRHGQQQGKGIRHMRPEVRTGRTQTVRVLHSTPRKQRAALPLAAAAVAVFTTVAAPIGTTSASGATSPNATGRTAVASDQPSWARAGTDQGAVAVGATLTARVILAGRDPSGLAAFALAVSTPGDEAFQHFLTAARLQKRFGPTARQVSAVTRWLTGSGLTITDRNSHWVDVSGPASAMQTAFGTRIDSFTAADGRTHHAPTSGATVPTALAGAVSAVAGLADPLRGTTEGATSAAAARAASSTTATASLTATAAAAAVPLCSPDFGSIKAVGYPAGYTKHETLGVCDYTPSQLRGAYGVTASGRTGTGVTVAIVDAYGSPTMLADANRFAANHGDSAFAVGKYTETVTPGQWQHVSDGLCQAPSDWAGEQSLDVEMVHGLAPDASVHYYGANSCLDADFIATMAGIVDAHSADVVSMSFGETMHETIGDLDPATITAETQIFMDGAAEGIGFDGASGDCGNDAARLAGPNCDAKSARAQVEWPSSSVWVTAVGGTALSVSHGGEYRWETGMGDLRSVLSADGSSWQPAIPAPFFFGGGGGTSEDFAQPAYQANVVPYALSHTLGDGSHTTTAMRTSPDVAMNGDLYTAVATGQTDPATGVFSEGGVGGTSVSTPEFAALQADAMQTSRSPLGFANPLLYSKAGSDEFTDVVAHPDGAPPVISSIFVGLNPDGTKRVRLIEFGQDNGLTATPGYDLATGLGSPRENYLTSVN